MIVFSNTTPFIALSSIGRLSLLPQLFNNIRVARSVIAECAEGGSIVVPDLLSLSWIVPIHDVETIRFPVLLELDRGEKQTIALAMNEPGALVIIDEKIGRNIAEYLGLHVIGTLGILAKARRMQLIESFQSEANAMIEKGIHFNKKLINRIAEELEVNIK